MKKLIVSILAIALLLAGSLFFVRQLAGWNDGMTYSRSEIHAAVLGDNIYIVGGIGLFRVLDSCEIFTTKNATWKPCAPLPRPLHHVAMAADDNRVYASGGYVALPFEQDQDSALFAYDPVTNKWIELAKLPHPLGQHAMIHRDGKLYLIGGQNGAQEISTFWQYDISTRKWSQMPAMPTARHSHAIAMSNDRLFVTGGRNAKLGSEIAKVEMFDFASDEWTTLPDMPTGRAGHGAYVRDNQLHIVGGESLSESALIEKHEILDLSALAWKRGENNPQFARHGFAVGDGPSIPGVYIIGGGARPGFQTIYSVTGTTQQMDN